VQRAIEIAHAAGVPVLLNPAPAQPLPASMLHQIDLLVPNESEASVLSGIPVRGQAGAAEAAAELVRAGCGAVLVTLGPQGLVLLDSQGCHHHPAQAVCALDTTGAGDTFIGALAAARVDGLPPWRLPVWKAMICARPSTSLRAPPPSVFSAAARKPRCQRAAICARRWAHLAMRT
jgi:sugar/nucleoside kinase (ribokinase family)